MNTLDHRTAYRKTIVPWYDSEAICLVMIILMLLVLIFAYIGLRVTQDILAYADYLWIPVLLMTISITIILSTTIRLIRRHISRR